jgi:hypothetical protein
MFVEAAEAFRIIGAFDAADELQRIAWQYCRTSNRLERRARVRRLEQRLSGRERDVESKLAAHAGGVLRVLRTEAPRDLTPVS